MNAFDRKVNLEIIEQVRNLPIEALSSYIDVVILPLSEANASFCETLYQDILFILNGFDREGEGDLFFDENGELVIENGDLKLSGYQTSLHYLCNWLHIQGVENLFENTDGVFNVSKLLEIAEEKREKKNNYTPEMLDKLEIIKKDLIKERNQNFDFPEENHKK